MDALLPSDPKKIGSFTLVARLGSGGMGVVYLAKRGVQRVALKVLNRESEAEPSARERFIREAQSLEKVDSPRISRLVDWSGADDEQWLAMEFINGPNLRELVVSDGPFALEEWTNLAGGLLEALKELHAKQIIHRDIKPSNIVISDRGPVVIDLGISQMIDATRLTRTGGVEGSPAWLAPEQLESEEYGIESDVFSLGSVLVFAGRGSSPWGNDETLTVPVVFSRILNDDPLLDGLLPTQLQLLSRMLVKSPRERASAVELLDELNRTVTAEGVGPVGAGPSKRESNSKVPEGPLHLGRELVHRSTGTRKLPERVGSEDLQKTEYLAESRRTLPAGQNPKVVAEAPASERSDSRRKVGSLAFVAAALAIVGGSGLYLTSEPSNIVTVKTLSLEWTGGDLYQSYSPDGLLQDHYIISGETLTRSSCLSREVVLDYEGRRIQPTLQVFQELGNSDYQWLPISSATYGELECPDGFESVIVSSDSNLYSEWSSDQCTQIRYLEPDSGDFPEREENWCVLRTNPRP